MGNDPIKGLVKQVVGITDEDYEIFKAGSPGVQKFFSRIEDVMNNRIVAEVIESKYCAAGLKVGQTIVIEAGALIPEKSTAPLCMRAIGPLEATQLSNRQDALFLDIRDEGEYRAGHIPEAVHIPLKQLSQRITELEKHKGRPVIAYCRSGSRAFSPPGRPSSHCGLRLARWGE